MCACHYTFYLSFLPSFVSFLVLSFIYSFPVYDFILFFHSFAFSLPSLLHITPVSIKFSITVLSTILYYSPPLGSRPHIILSFPPSVLRLAHVCISLEFRPLTCIVYAWRLSITLRPLLTHVHTHLLGSANLALPNANTRGRT